MNGQKMTQNIKPYRAAEAARLLSEGFIGGVAHGRAEAGPRALGNRSILSDARNVRQKERINGYMKMRRAFQPLAPLCLEEDYHRFFETVDCEISLDYMLYAIKCKPQARTAIPAVVHADDTARVQVIREDNYPFLYELLTEYKKITGIGVLINTSLNAKGEPIANTPMEAYQIYKKMDLDFLVLDKYLISNKVQ